MWAATLFIVLPATAHTVINRATELINSSSYDEALTLLNALLTTETLRHWTTSDSGRQ